MKNVKNPKTLLNEAFEKINDVTGDDLDKVVNIINTYGMNSTVSKASPKKVSKPSHTASHKRKLELVAN